jgi:hypothetical protein
MGKGKTFKISKEDFETHKSEDGKLRFLYKITHIETGLIYVGRKTAKSLTDAQKYKGSSTHDLFKDIKNLWEYEWEVLSYHPEGIVYINNAGEKINHEYNLICSMWEEHGVRCVNRKLSNIMPYVRTEEHRLKMSLVVRKSIETGVKKIWNKGKHLTKEDRLNKKISANKPEVKEKARRQKLGRIWYNNGVEEKCLKQEHYDELEDKALWIIGRLPKTKEKWIKNLYLCPYCINYVSIKNQIKKHIVKVHKCRARRKYIPAIEYLELDIVQKFLNKKGF